jgi:hypothetical protein
MTRAANRIKVMSTAADKILGEGSIQIIPAFTFSAGLATHRIYLVEHPVTYLCDLNAGTLQRFSGYSVAPLQSSIDTVTELVTAGATGGVIARNITSCAFVQNPDPTGGSSQIVTVQLSATVDGVTANLYEIAAVRPLE